jgi:hypothetical protein
VSSIGWTGLGGNTGVCSIETNRGSHQPRHPRAAESVRRVEQTDRAITISRARVEPTRSSHPDNARVAAAAARLGSAVRHALGVGMPATAAAPPAMARAKSGIATRCA